MMCGSADAAKLKANPGEVYEPALVGGRAMISAWFNSWADLDNVGASHETWCYTCVIPKGQGCHCPMIHPCLCS